MNVNRVIERIAVHADTFVDAGDYFSSTVGAVEYRVYETGVEIRSGDDIQFKATGPHYYRQLKARK